MNKQINEDGEKNITDKMTALIFLVSFFFFLCKGREKKKKRRNKEFIFKLLFRDHKYFYGAEGIIYHSNHMVQVCFS